MTTICEHRGVSLESFDRAHPLLSPAQQEFDRRFEQVGREGWRIIREIIGDDEKARVCGGVIVSKDNPSDDPITGEPQQSSTKSYGRRLADRFLQHVNGELRLVGYERNDDYVYVLAHTKICCDEAIAGGRELIGRLIDSERADAALKVERDYAKIMAVAIERERKEAARQERLVVGTFDPKDLKSDTKSFDHLSSAERPTSSIKSLGQLAAEKLIHIEKLDGKILVAMHRDRGLWIGVGNNPFVSESDAQGARGYAVSVLGEVIDAEIARERERCAKVAREHRFNHGSSRFESGYQCGRIDASYAIGQ